MRDPVDRLRPGRVVVALGDTYRVGLGPPVGQTFDEGAADAADVLGEWSRSHVLYSCVNSS